MDRTLSSRGGPQPKRIGLVSLFARNHHKRLLPALLSRRVEHAQIAAVLGGRDKASVPPQ